MTRQVRFTRAFKGLIYPPSEPPGEIMSFGVSPVNYSDSDSDDIISPGGSDGGGVSPVNYSDSDSDDIISPGGSDGGEISPLNARV